MSKYSILRDSQKFLIIKTPETNAPFVIARCDAENFAELICHLLQKNEEQKADVTQEAISKAT